MLNKNAKYGLIVATALLGANVALAAAPTDEQGTGEVTIAAAALTLVEHATTDTVVDIGPAGDSRGDLLAFRNEVFNAANDTKVGQDQGSCVRVEVGVVYECNFSVQLEQGTLVVEGAFYDDGRDNPFAIIGGTGIYDRARGSMVFRPHTGATGQFDFIFTIKK